MFAIEHPKNGEIFAVNEFWLRDHCRCNICYNEETKQRKINLLNIPENVTIMMFSTSKCDQTFKVVWSDGHESSYDIDFVYCNSQLGKWKSEPTKTQTPWDGAVAQMNQQDIRIKLENLISSEDIVKKAVGALVRYGILLIEGVPPNTDMTEMTMRRLFPIMKTFFGEMFTFSDKQDHADSAYSKAFIGVHTDNTYFCDAAGLHSLHCIEHVGGTGGENFFVDGLRAVLELQREHKAEYNILSSVPVPAEYIEAGQHHKYTAPIIRTDPVTGAFEQLRLNLYDRAVFNTLPQEQMTTFYKSLRVLLNILERKENEWSFKLEPGTYVIFDNWRILHARYAYTGSRTMTGCYVQRTDFLSRARTLGLID